MKRMIDDGMLDTAAKSFIKHYEGANAPTDVPSSENSYFTSIKVAKAKAGARVRINRTIRICAVAAVLMVGLVCALFMGADEDETIKLVKEAYLWRYDDLEYEGMLVNVCIDFKLDEERAKSSQYFGEIVVTDKNGNILYDFCHIQLVIGDNENTPRGSLWVYYDPLECPDGHKDENGKRIGQYGKIDFNKSKSEAVIKIYEGNSRIWIHDDSYEDFQGNPLLIITSATNREDAVAFTEDFYKLSK